MIERLHLNDMVLFYNMASIRPGPYPAKVVAINSDNTIDLEVFKDANRIKEFGVMSRNMAESGRMWDWPKTKAVQ